MAKAVKGAALRVRLTPAELETLLAQAEARGLTLSDYVRACLFRDAPPDPRTQALGQACVQLLELLKSSLEEEGVP
jgi:hypothetical protein